MFSISAPNRLIPDGSTLYTCNLQIAETAANANYALTVSNVSLSFPTPPGGSVPGATGGDGSVQVGAVGPTNTPVTPVGPTETPVTPVPSGPGVAMLNVSGNAGDTVQVTAVLSVGGVTPGIAGAQNDFSFDSANLTVQGRKVCKSDPTTSCTTDPECVAATGTAGDTCIVVPDCTVN